MLTNKKSCDKILNVDGESQKQKKTLNLENWTVENKPKPKVNSKLERAKKVILGNKKSVKTERQTLI